MCALSFARNRPWLYSLSQEPDLSFCVWDWESGLTVCKATALTQSVQLLANPTNEHFSAMVTRSAITLWHVREMHDQHSLSALQLTPPAPERSEGGDDDIDLAALGGAVAEGGVSSFSAIAWGSDTLLYASTASALLCCFEVPGGAEVAERRVQLPAAAACLLSLRQHLLAAVGFDVLFLELESLAVCLRVRVGAPTRHLALSPLCTSLLAECADGEVRRLVLAQPNKIPSTADAARAAAAQLAAESAEGGAAEDGADEGGADEPVSVVSIGSAHAGAVLGLGLLPALDGGASEHGPPPCAITCGADGTLRLWDIASASLLLSEALPAGTQPTALAVCRPNALVALGSDRGVLRLYRRTPAGSLAAVFVRRFSASPIAALGFDADGAYLAVAHEDGTVAFVCTFKALKTLGVCVGAVPSRPVALSFVGGSATARLLLSCADRTVVRLLPPALSTPTADDVRLTRADVLPRATKLPALAHALAAAPPALGAGGLLAALSDGSVRLFHCAPDDYAGGALQGDEVGVRVGGEAGGAAGAAAPPLAGEVCARHPTPALALGVSADGRHFISGSAAGVILVSEAVPAEGAARAEVSIRAHDSLLGGVAHVGLLASHGHESLALVSAGADGLLYFGELSVSDGPCSLPPLPPNELNSAPVPPEEADAEDEAVPDALDTAVAHVSAEESARRAAAREAGHARLSELQRKLASLLERNERADELERLPMAELVVDEKLRAQLAAEAQAEAAALKQAARRANLRKELLWARLKAELVEPMATAGVAILPLPLPEVDIDAPAAGVVVAAANARKAAGGAEAGAQELPPAVTNYPLRRPTDAEARAQRGIALLREVELRERAWLATERLGEEELALTAFEDPAALTAAIGVLPGEEADGKANAAKAALAGVAGADENEDDEDEAEAAADAAHAADEADGADADADAADGAHAPEIASRRQSAAAAAAAVAAAAAAAAAPSSSAAAPAPGAGASAHHAVALLAAAAGRPLTTRELAYPPYELYTERRQIAAAHLHAQLVWQAKAKFNGQFDGLLAHKRKEMEKIVEKDQRVNEICAELGEPSAAYKPQLSELEEPERQLSVHPSEIAAQRWETAEDRQRREANEKLASERAAAAERDDAARRALKQMMHGTLERKREAELSESLVRPAWMSAKPPEEMSEAELAQVRDYEAAAKKVEEERDKLRKGLHAELAKLHAETAEICRAFNAKLAALAATKLGYEQAVYEHELVLIKAAHSHARAAQAAEQEEQMAAELERLIGRRAETSAARSAFAARVERWREGLEKAEAENRLRGNEKTFRHKEFADAPEHVDALWRLFKRRELVTVRTDVARAEAGEDDVELDAGAATADGSVPPASAASGAAGAPSRTDLVTVRGVSDLDPFLPADQAAIPRKEEVQPLDPAAEMPEGLSFALWDRLDRLRAEKVQREEEVAERKAALESMETCAAASPPPGRTRSGSPVQSAARGCPCARFCALPISLLARAPA